MPVIAQGSQLAGSSPLTQASRLNYRRLSNEQQLEQAYNTRLRKTQSVANVVRSQQETANPMLAVTKVVFAAIAASTAFIGSKRIVQNNLTSQMKAPITNLAKQSSGAIKQGYGQFTARFKEGSKAEAVLNSIGNKISNLKLPTAADILTKPMEILAGVGSAASVAKVAMKGKPEEALTELQKLGDQVDGKLDGKMGDVPIY